MRTLTNALPVMSIFEIPAGLPEQHPLREFYDDRAYDVDGFLVIEIHQDGKRVAYVYFRKVNGLMICIACDFEEEYYGSNIIVELHEIAETIHGGLIQPYENEVRVDPRSR